MATTAELNQLYLAYFGRPADASGLAFYAGLPLSQVAADFSASPESRALYGDGTFGAAQVSQVYSALFNRPAEPGAVAAWSALLTSSKLSPAALALDILQAAQNDDKAAATNKLAFATQWSASFQAQADTAGASAASALALAKALLAGVGATQASLATTLAVTPAAIGTLTAPAPAADTPAPAPQTFTLTTGADTITGGPADDTINAIANYTAGTENPTSTLNAATDTINGGGGTDTLALTTGGTTPVFSIDPARVTSVERLLLTIGAPNTTVNLATASSFTEIVVSGNTTGAVVQGFGANVSKLGVTDRTVGTLSLNAEGSALAGNSDAVTLTLTNDGTSSSTASITLQPQNTGDFYETLNIVSAGTANYVTLGTGTTQTSLATVNISGSAPLTLVPAASDNFRIAITYDASASTGGVVLGSASANNALGLANQTVKLGSGDDTVFFGANLTSADTVDGGAGRDSLSIVPATNQGITSATTLTHVSNVEVLRYDLSTSALTQDMSLLAGHGLTDLAINKSLATSITLNNMPASGLTVVDLLSTLNTGSSNLAMTLANGSGSNDTLTVRFANTAATAVTLNTLSNVTGLETLNIDSGGSASGYTITTDKVAAQQVLTGSVNFTVTGSGNTPMNFDASAYTGKLNIAAAPSSTDNDTVVLGSGNDTVSMLRGTNIITLGAQGSNAVAGADTIVAAGTTTVRFVGDTAIGNGAAGGYGAASINAATIGSSTGGTGNVSILTLAFSANDGDFSLANAAGTSSTGLAKGSVAQGLAAGDSLAVGVGALNVAQGSVGGGVAAAATANLALFELTTAVAFSTDAKGTFQTALGTNSITGLAADANYLVALYDTTNARTVVAVVNTGASGAGDTNLSAADFTDTGMAVVAVVGSNALGGGMVFGAAF